MTSAEPESPGIIPVPPPAVFAGPLIIGLSVRRLLPGVPLPRLLRRVFGGLLLIGGAALAAWFFRTMQQAETPVDPRKPVRALVVEGPFQFTRNPGYLGMATICAGVPLMANSLPSLLLLPVALAVITKGVIEREEAYLERRFGEPYRDYKARVRRWF
jgi:protein-S-isoprenylcysteine O-methyltransferase Ste14